MAEIQNYPDLKVNGRLFPLWILANFKKYALPPIERPAAVPVKLVATPEDGVPNAPPIAMR
jgi:hypothetical protein